MKTVEFEREFFRLAGTMLSALHDVVEFPCDRETFRFHLLGYTDYAYEMDLLCQDVLWELQRGTRPSFIDWVCGVLTGEQALPSNGSFVAPAQAEKKEEKL